MPTLVYCAGPYSRPDPAENTRIAVEYGEQVWNMGLVPYVPHLTHYWELQVHHPYEDWLAYDLHWLRKCDVVLRFPGESSGADKEVAEAERLGIPVVYSVDELRAFALKRKANGVQ